MRLVADPGLRYSVTSFGAKLAEDGLHLPPEVYAMAKAWNAMTAEEFFSAASCMMAIVNVPFLWPCLVAPAALAELAAILRGHMPDAVLAHHAEPRVEPPARHAPPPDYAEVFERTGEPDDEK